MSTARRLATLVSDAAAHVPFYRELWREHRVDVAALRFPQDLARLPIVLKPALLATPARARADDRSEAWALRRTLTSGSTGEPLELWLEKAAARARQREFLGALLGAGYFPGQRLMLVSSRPAQAIKHVSPWARAARWHYVDLYSGEAELVAAYARIRPHAVYGPLASLLLLAGAAQSLRGTHLPRHVISTSEQLTPAARARLRAGFDTDVTDFFGLSEVGLVACRFKDMPCYRTASSPGGWPLAGVAGGRLILEFIPSTVAPGCERLVVTDLTARAMPFIRYDTGDLVQRDHAAADRPIVALHGKQLDFISMPDGTRIAPYDIDRALGELHGVQRYQVTQQADLRLTLAVLPDEAGLRERAQAALRAATRAALAIELTAFDATASAHKLRPVRSLVRPAA